MTEKFGKNIGLLRQREVHEEDHEVRRLLGSENEFGNKELINSWQKIIEYDPTRSAPKEPRRNLKG